MYKTNPDIMWSNVNIWENRNIVEWQLLLIEKHICETFTLTLKFLKGKEDQFNTL